MTRSGKFVVTQIAKTDEDDPATKGQPLKTKCQKLLQHLEYVLLLVNRLLIGFVSIYMVWTCLRLDPSSVPWHAVLSTLGFVCLMSEGLLAHYRGNAWSHLCYRAEKTRTHWILQLVGSGLGIAGIAVKFDLEQEHFYTTHGQLGLVCFVLCLCSLLTGCSSLYAADLKNRLQPLINKAVHNVIGLGAYTAAMASMFFAFDTPIFAVLSLDAAHYEDFRILLKAVILLIWLLSSYGPLWCLVYSKLWRCC